MDLWSAGKKGGLCFTILPKAFTKPPLSVFINVTEALKTKRTSRNYFFDAGRLLSHVAILLSTAALYFSGRLLKAANGRIRAF